MAAFRSQGWNSWKEEVVSGVVEVEGGREGKGHEDCVQDEVIRREKLGVNGSIRKKGHAQ